MLFPRLSPVNIELAPGSEKRFSLINVCRRVYRLWPFTANDFSAQLLWARFSVPSYLFHIVIELQALAVRVKGMRHVVHAGVEIGWNRVVHPHAARAQKRHGIAQLLVGGQLQAEGHTGRVSA